MRPLPYTRHRVTEEDIEAVVRVLRSDHLTQGPVVEEFEAALAAYTGAKFAVAVSSGTAALHLAYLAAGVGYVVTSPLSFVATANAAFLAGSACGFVDVSLATGNVEVWPSDKRAPLAVPVHYAGRAAIVPHAFSIEDACHALGAMDFDSCSRIGSCAHSLATVFSFHPAKALTTGEGGAVTTNDRDFAERVRTLRQHGRVDGQMVALGPNYRMPDINAALGLSQLRRLDERISIRRALAGLYTVHLLEIDGCGFERPLWGPADECDRHAWHLYPIRIKGDRRDEVKAKLNAAGIGAQVHYDPIVPFQPYYRDRFGYHEGQFPNAEAFVAEELSLPLFPEMTVDDVERVVDALKEALG